MNVPHLAVTFRGIALIRWIQLKQHQLASSSTGTLHVMVWCGTLSIQATRPEQYTFQMVVWLKTAQTSYVEQVNSVSMTTRHDNNPVRTAGYPPVLYLYAVSLTVHLNTFNASFHKAHDGNAVMCHSISLAAHPGARTLSPHGLTQYPDEAHLCGQNQSAATTNECMMLCPLVFDNGPLLPWPPSTPSSSSRIPTGGNFWHFPWNSPSGWCRSPWRRLPAH